jgi:hypothetical protein
MWIPRPLVETRLAASQTAAVRCRDAVKHRASPQGVCIERRQRNLLSNPCPLQQSLGAGAGYVDHRLIGDDLIEDGLNGRDLD